MILRLDGQAEVKVDRVGKQIKLAVVPLPNDGRMVYLDMAEVKALIAAMAELSKG